MAEEPPRFPAPQNILVTGPTASGKTTLAGKIRDTFGVPILHKSEVWVQCARQALGRDIARDDIRTLSVPERALLSTLVEITVGQIVSQQGPWIIDDHLCVVELTPAGRQWRVAPLDYLQVHRVGLVLALFPNDAQILANHRRGATLHARSRIWPTLQSVQEEKILIYTTLHNMTKTLPYVFTPSQGKCLGILFTSVPFAKIWKVTQDLIHETLSKRHGPDLSDFPQKSVSSNKSR